MVVYLPLEANRALVASRGSLKSKHSRSQVSRDMAFLRWDRWIEAVVATNFDIDILRLEDVVAGKSDENKSNMA
jgi:hypothetical protein